MKLFCLVVFYLPDILSPKIGENLEIAMVLRFKIIVKVRIIGLELGLGLGLALGFGLRLGS